MLPPMLQGNMENLSRSGGFRSSRRQHQGL